MGEIMVKGIRAFCIRVLTLKGKLDCSRMLANASHAQAVNDRLLKKLLWENRNTEYGKKYGFGSIKSPEEYRRRVPLSDYRTYAPYVERIYNENARKVLTASRVIGFARSSGSVGSPKLTPLTNPAISIYTRYTVTRFLALADRYHRQSGRKIRPGRGICALPRFEEVSPCGLPATNVADVAARKYGPIYPFILNLPLNRQFLYDEIENRYAEIRFGLEDRETMYMFSVFSKTIAELMEYMQDHWPMLVKDIEEGTIDASIQVRDDVRKKLQRRLRPNPGRAAELRREFEKGFDETILSRVWPNLSVISTIGTSDTFRRFTDRILSYSESIAMDYSIYGASEGLFAAAYRCNEQGLLLLTDSCYYEFIDVQSENETETLTLSQLRVGGEYEIIITNQMGFYRYRFGDVIRVLGFEGECPVINFVYRKGQLLNITGEKTDFAQMTEAIRRLEQLSGARVRNWCVFVDKGITKYRYGILLETFDGQNLSGYSEALEQILRDVNASYRFYAGKDLIELPVIHMQRPGSHEEWKQLRISLGASPEQVKPVNILDTEEKKQFFLSRRIS